MPPPPLRESPPSNNLWVGNLSGSVSDEDLMELFGQFGALDATSYGTRCYGFVFFKRVEEATKAKESLQGTVVKGLPITVEFARPAKPSRQLWVGGISSKVSKEDLEEEFIKFGEISDFKFFRDRNTALFEYVQLEDASQAMRSMNGKLLGGEQMRVDFLRSQPIKRDQWAENRDFVGHIDAHAGDSRRQQEILGSRRGEEQPSKILWVGYPPSRHIDETMLHNAMILFGEIEKIKTFPSRNYSFVEFRSVDEARRAKEGLQGRLFNDPRITILFSSSELAPRDNSAFQPGVRGELSVNGHNTTILPGAPQLGTGSDLRWKRPSPPMLQSPVHDIRTPLGFSSGPRDISEVNQLSKRSRIEARPNNEPSLSWRNMDDRGLLLDHGINAADDGSLLNVPGNRLSPPPKRFRRGPGQGPDNDYIWRGPITKGGQPVCFARCIPIGEGLTAELPEVVDCAARTGLDMLANHYKEGDDFEVVFFLPDSEEDFASYTEFLMYLSSRDRAGVAKLVDGTSLFLVPPSDFLKRVLRVTGPERLYGVVLTASRKGAGNAPMPRQPLMHHSDRIPPGLIRHEEAHPVDSAEVVRSLHKQNLPHSSLPLARQSPATIPPIVQSVSHDTATTNPLSVSQGGISLTPELIASLASLIPPKTSLPSELPPQNLRPPHVPAMQSKEFSTQGWNQINQVTDPVGYSMQQLGNQMSSQGPSASQIQPYHPVPYADKQPVHSIITPQQSQPVVANSLQYAPVSSGLLNPVNPSHGGQYIASTQIGQQYQPETLFNNQRGYQMAPGNTTAPAAPYSSSVAVSSGNNVCNPMFSMLPQSQVAMPTTNGQVSAEIPNVSQQLSSAASGAAPGKDEVDKNQRYQSTLQFAANLLLQIQQQQQQRQQQGGHGATGSGNPQ
ncbi:hypothetical protein MLD38_019662 [Melastoma candidum]|uniref:Uncharacterized protein n=1 Tax=Melastoma candidum TaxID=119954 RepID=A0ACB9QYT2_9MYRT|nr:hypothetical protein MLD38_019662 [Melastoma candidum]